MWIKTNVFATRSHKSISSHGPVQEFAHPKSILLIWTLIFLSPRPFLVPNAMKYRRPQMPTLRRFFPSKFRAAISKNCKFSPRGSTGSYITVSVRVQPFFCGGSCSFCQFANTAASRKLLSRAFYLRSSSLRMGNYFSGSASNDASASNDVQPSLSSYTFERLDKSEPNLSFTELHGSVIFGVRRMGWRVRILVQFSIVLWRTIEISHFNISDEIWNTRIHHVFWTQS